MLLYFTITFVLVSLGLAFSPLQIPTNYGAFPHSEMANPDSSDPSIFYRIPTDVIPTHYKLDIRPILSSAGEDQFTAPGKVTITLECQSNTKSIVLHASELDIDESSIQVWDKENEDESLPQDGFTSDEKTQTITIKLLNELIKGKSYVISMKFIAKIAAPEERMNGLYRSSYKPTDGGEEQWLATTHFSRTRAFRKVFPSFDEPTHKAIFEISIGREERYHSLSNMNIRETSPIEGMPGWEWDHFEPTPIMPATVIAMVISTFHDEEAPPDLYRLPVKVWGPPDVIANGDGKLAAEAVAKSLKVYEDYFSIPYELPKMDSAGLNDFAAGAMENWGLNLYRAANLFSNSDSTAASKFNIPRIISHEIAHQWWGNLVTHAWWNDWWLTEGFGTYYQFFLLNKSYPEYTPMIRQITDDFQEAMAFDITKDSVPIHGSVTEDFVENPSEINYSKGSSLVRMMSGFLSESVFKEAVIHYLNKEKYKAVDQYVLFEDLQESIEKQDAVPINGKSITQIMDTWTLQSGFPLVRVSKSTSTPNTIYFSQESFQQGNEVDPERKAWYIPISYASESNPSFEEPNILPKLWIDNDTILVPHAFKTDEWIVVNPDTRGYYRVIYDDHFSALLLTQLKSGVESISEGSRSQIVDDHFSAAYERYITFKSAFQMFEFIEGDTSYGSWIPFLNHLRKPYMLFMSQEADREALKRYLLPKMDAVVEKVGLEQPEEELILNTIFRVRLLDWYCGMRHTSCLNYAKRLFDKWRVSPDPDVNPIPVDLRSILYCAASAEGTVENWDWLKSRYEATSDVTFRSALKCTTDPDRLEGLINEAFPNATTPTAVESDEVYDYIALVASNPIGREKVLDLLDTDLEKLFEYVGNVNGLESVFDAMAPFVSAPTEISKIEGIVTENAEILEPVRQKIDSAIGIMNSNTEWMYKYGEKILDVLGQSI